MGAINLYTQNALYQRLNEALRAKSRKTALGPYYSYLRLLFHALSKLPPATSRHTRLYRGVEGDLKSYYAEDKKITWWGFSSCTLRLRAVEDFLPEKGPRTLFTIFTTEGAHVSPYSGYRHEAEVLLLPGSRFTVEGVLVNGELTIVELRQEEGRLVS